MSQLTLMLFFLAPAKANLIINFDIDTHGGLIDKIMTTEQLIIFTGINGDTPSKCLARGHGGIPLQVGTLGQKWEDMWMEFISWRRNVSPAIAHKMKDEWRRVMNKKWPVP